LIGGGETAPSLLVNRSFADALGQILSLRGDKLTIVMQGRKHTTHRSGKVVWVIQASARPRAWCKLDAPLGQSSESWREARFPCDELLVHPDVCREAMAEMVKVCGASRKWHLVMGARFDFDTAKVEQRRRMAALARSRRHIRALRAARQLVGLRADEQRQRFAHIRRAFGVWEHRRDDENEQETVCTEPHPSEPAQDFQWSRDVSVIDDALVGESAFRVPISNSTLIARRRLLRTWLRLKWLRQWLLCFPADAMELLLQSYPCRRWHLLTLWLRVPASRDLFRDIPALAFAMASANAFREKPVQRPLRSLRALICGKRKRLLAWLGFPATPLTLRLMRLIRPEHLTMELLFDLRRVMNSAACHAAELVSRGTCLDHRTIRLIVPPILPTLRVLRELLCREKEMQSLWFDSVRIARILNDAGQLIERLTRINSLNALRLMHDHLVALHRIQSQQIPLIFREKFPLTAPFAGMPGITPLIELDAVIGESIRMRHCLDTYISLMAEGQYVAYSIRLDDECATLGLRKTGGHWDIDQLQGPNNSAVSEKLRRFVHDWQDRQGVAP
jgi:hypothetical protein